MPFLCEEIQGNNLPNLLFQRLFEGDDSNSAELVYFKITFCNRDKLTKEVWCAKRGK